MGDFSLLNFSEAISVKIYFIMFTLPRKPKYEYNKFGIPGYDL